MPALMTHRLFGEESLGRLPEGIVSSEDERTAFLLANQGPDPFFFRFRGPRPGTCRELGSLMHRCRMSRQFEAFRNGVSYLRPSDAGIGRAWTLGMLSHYVLDRNAHPFVYAQQWGIQEADSELKDAGGQVHAVIESDIDVLMLNAKRHGATVEDCPPADELASDERVDKVAGALASFAAGSVYGIEIGANEYGAAVRDMRLVYRAIEPAGSPRSRAIARIEGLAKRFPLLQALAHRATAHPPAGASNLERRLWTDPFTGRASTEGFPDIFERALDDYEVTALRFIDGGDMGAVTGHVNYSGRPLDPDEQFDREE